MGTFQMDSIVKNVLKNLCCNYGWCYGAFWSYQQPNSSLPILQDAYFDEKFEGVIDNSLLQVPIGGGIIGQVAYTNKHMWMTSEDHYKQHSFSGSIWDMFLDEYEFRRQFSSGMKTIVVIPVEPQGVVRFGSNQKILENMEFVNQTKRIFREIVNGGRSEFYSYSSNQSLISSEDLNLVFDSLPDFGIPDEFFRTEEFNVSQWFSPPKNDLFSPSIGFNPFDSDVKRESPTISCIDVDVIGNNGGLEAILAPVKGGNRSGFHSFSSESESKPKPKPDQHDHDITSLGRKERLFSKLGIEELLEGISGISNVVSTSCIEGDQVSVKRRKIGNCKWEVSSLQKEVIMPKLETSLQMVDAYSGSGSSVVLQGENRVEPVKPTKKKAKPGTRPRPKDRQQILDRMAELRQLIPSGEKMSIDCLLDRTIKHMMFLESVTKQSDRIKQAEEPKRNSIDSNDPSTNGVTWACELGNQTMVCPLIVEDLGATGQMIIEMLCEEQGFFLEIMDIIRRFGLIILKGVMEARGDKIYARFIVEPEVNKNVTRHEIFLGLVQFLQTMDPNEDKTCMKAGNSLLDDFHQFEIQNLMNLVDMQHCVNL
ncbi:transcription factor LHW [Lactuca sativa]|uniref:BHLH domain-containing protein n=1 Tax=Lactuca sativa TaxID=4236 RepID=A0A9R1V5I5_LACSA|nr:transcription factor LHW [Lactuca sativa]KAJ0200587.1 hypothetical protein LSAT_V11C600329870 [Lactuca sativa]